MIVHQFIANLEPGAVGAHTLLARRLLRDAGHASDIFTDLVAPASEGDGARPVRDYRGGADVLVYQMAIGSFVADTLLAHREPLVVNYHNLTPLRFLNGWDPAGTHGVAWGRAQLRDLAARATLGLAVSSYNEHELIEAGFARTTVIPYLFDPGTTPRSSKHRRTGSTTWLFVGRLAANKAQHDIVKAFAAYRLLHDPDAELRLVGGGVDEPYGRTLRRFVHALGLDDAVSLTGGVTPAGLGAHYAAADVLVVCSDHEGFCVPLLEAMHNSVPIVAYASAAVPETLGDAGLLLDVKDPYTIAEAVHHVVTDGRLRTHLIGAGHARLAEFSLARTGAAFVDTVTAAAAVGTAR